MVGTDGDDVLRATKEADVIVTGAGNDTVYSSRHGTASDHIRGGPGDDYLVDGLGNVKLKGGPGRDDLGPGNDNAWGGADDDRISAEGRNNYEIGDGTEALTHYSDNVARTRPQAARAATRLRAELERTT
jgi:Ca2+-binding RTX toxin-like protein